MGRKRALIAGKHLIYCFGLIFCYVLQTTPGFLQIFGVKPFLVIPAVIAIAMRRRPSPSAPSAHSTAGRSGAAACT
mgnify:CR=1 FL=1